MAMKPPVRNAAGISAKRWVIVKPPGKMDAGESSRILDTGIC
jgi:hypothetical protein